MTEPRCHAYGAWERVLCDRNWLTELAYLRGLCAFCSGRVQVCPNCFNAETLAFCDDECRDAHDAKIALANADTRIRTKQGEHNPG